MKTFLIMPNNSKWEQVEASTHETAYRAICSWYSPDTNIAVMDVQTGVTEIFNRTVSSTGNLEKINRIFYDQRSMDSL